jgi:NADPH-dependent curcumin reductase CurA
VVELVVVDELVELDELELPLEEDVDCTDSTANAVVVCVVDDGVVNCTAAAGAVGAVVVDVAVIV